MELYAGLLDVIAADNVAERRRAGRAATISPSPLRSLVARLTRRRSANTAPADASPAPAGRAAHA